MRTGIAVVIVNWNAGELLKECLDAVYRQTLMPNQVIVIDNASSDNSLVGLDERYPQLIISRQDSNLGFSVANNIALRDYVNTYWVALLNPDAIPDPSWLLNLSNAAKENPKYSFFASTLIKKGNKHELDGVGDVYHVSGLAWRRLHGVNRKLNELEDCDIFSPCAAAAMYKKSILDEVSGFDEDFFCYFEDVDLSFRLRLLGYRCLYVSKAVVSHVGSATTGQDSDFSVYYGHRNLVWTFIKNMPLPLLVLYMVYHLCLNILTIIWYVYKGRGRLILRSKWDAIKGVGQAIRKRRNIQRTRTIKTRDIWNAMEGTSIKLLMSRRGQ